MSDSEDKKPRRRKERQPAAGEMLDRQPPCSVEAEMAVLGSILLLPDNCDEVALILRPEDFYDDANRRLYEHMLRMYDSGQKIDLMLLIESLKSAGHHDLIGGAAYFHRVRNAVATPAHAVYYAQIVRTKATFRSLILASTEILREAYDESQDAREMLSRAEQKIFSILDSRGSSNVATITDVLNEALDRMDARMRGEHISGGVETGYHRLDELTGGLHNSELIVLAARPSMGKCLTADAEIVLTDGRVVTIEQIVRDRGGELLTLNERLKLQPARPSAFVNDGVKPVFRVTTRLGRSVTVTAAHPFLTIRGWRPLREIAVGEAIAVPRRMDVFGVEQPPEHEMKLLGYLLGDGNLTGSTPRFTNGRKRLQDDFAHAVEQFGGVATQPEGSSNRTFTFRVIADPRAIDASRTRFAERLQTALAERKQASRACAAAVGVSSTLLFQWRHGRCSPSDEHLRRLAVVLQSLDLGEPLRKNGKNRLAQWLQSLGLDGASAATKHVPEIVFRATRERVAIFLNRLFATDGWVCTLASGQAQVGLVTVSERMARQVQHLLLRFGILAALREKRKKYGHERRRAWQLDITDARSLDVFCREIGAFGKDEAVRRVQAAIAARRYQTNCDLIPREVWRRIEQAKGNRSWAELAKRLGLGPGANLHQHRRGVSRHRLAQIAAALEDRPLADLAQSDVYWDEIVAIDEVGQRQVYDLTIPHTHNFVANDICVHNTALAMNIAEYAALELKVPTLFVSLEMSAIELADRLLCSVARVNGHRLRNGTISNEDRARLVEKAALMSQSPLYVDDSPARTVTEIAAAARRIHRREGRLGLIVIDYLQLIEPDNSQDPRQEQVARMTRRLKGLARDMKVPILCLAQLNRQAEVSKDNRPKLSHLRECVTGDTLVQLTNGQRVPIRDLVGQQPEVFAINSCGKIVAAQSDAVWRVGRRPVFEVRLASGRSLRATAAHRLYGAGGWRSLGELQPGDRLALVRFLPEPAEATRWPEARVGLLGHLIGDGSYLTGQPLRYSTSSAENGEFVAHAARQEFGATVRRYAGRGRWSQLLISGNGNRWAPAGVNRWLRELGIFGQRSFQKRVPPAAFNLCNEQIALLLRHLWATDGCIFTRRDGARGSHTVYYSTTSLGLATDVASLLLRCGIVARTYRVQQGANKPSFHVAVTGAENQRRFLEVVGAFGPRVADAMRLQEALRGVSANPNVDTVPHEFFSRVKQLMRAQGVSYRKMCAWRGTACGGGAHFRFAPSRALLADYAERLGDAWLQGMATNDLFWDRVVEIRPAGEDEVFDLTVPGPANWLADGIVTHNSGAIEQDADVVMFVHREEYYRRGDDAQQFAGQAEIIIAKQRNGPVGDVELTWRKEFTRFENPPDRQYNEFEQFNAPTTDPDFV